MYTLLSLSITSSVALLFWKYVISKEQRRPYPPGPTPKPIIGNFFDLPTKDLANVYLEWGRKCNSSIVHASALGTHIVVLNKVEDAAELLDRRAPKYSDRPEYPILKLMGWEHNVALMRYGEAWLYRRKIAHQSFRKEAVKNYYSVLLEKVHSMLDGLLKNPEKFDQHNRMLSVSIPMKTMYGYNVESIDDPFVTGADKSVTLGLEFLVPYASLINIFPLLGFIPAWFPGASSHKLFAQVKKLTKEVFRVPMEWAKTSMTEGTAVPSVFTEFLERKNTVGASAQEEAAIADIAYTAYGGATDTTTSVTGSFLYYMAIHPDIQDKAQREIDSIIGNRLPDFSDRPDMPYVEAIYREVLRSCPPVPMSFPHRLMEDDHYKGYFIPRGTILFPNIWAMMHEESVYPDPFKFKPERFLDENGKLKDEDRLLAFGFGRRVCVGEQVASATVWLTIVSMLATFNIGKAKDSSGNEIPINDEFDDFGLLVYKKHFECSITPRSRDHQQLIEAVNTSNL